ncbi:Calmodulin-binding protein 25 [Linum grandiflorum]
MASSSENLPPFDSWTFRPSFPDSWISESYSRDSDALTKALQQSLYSNITLSDPFTSSPDTPTPISCSSDPDSTTQPAPAPTAKPTRNSRAVPGATGKVSKRKPRASSKKSQTTFITADPANFRQMVQQVTGGVRFTDNLVPVLKPEPHRIATRTIHHQLAQGGGGLPTLDTSSFLLDHHQIQEGDNKPASFSNEVGPISYSGGGAGGGGDFDGFSSFPTLESWKVI